MSDKRWGCPWHGLVKNGQIHLPTGKSMPWPQQGGDTHLIDFSLPPVTTPAEHADKGMEWLSKAIIGGGRLHGFALPPGAWVYRDDNGENWLVDHELSWTAASAAAVTFTLRRFGVLGERGEEYSYTVSTPDLSGQDVQLSSLYFKVRSVHPAGSMCIIGVGSGDETRPPALWVELKISGAGSAASFDMQLIRSASETGGITLPPLPASTTAGMLSEKFYQLGKMVCTRSPDYDGPNCIGSEFCKGEWVEYASADDAGSGDIWPVSQTFFNDPQETGYVDRIIGIGFRNDGSVFEVSHTLKVTLSVFSGQPVVSRTDYTRVMELQSGQGGCAPVIIEQEFERLESTQSAESVVSLSSILSINGVPALSYSDSVSFSVQGGHVTSGDGVTETMGHLAVTARRDGNESTSNFADNFLHPNTGGAAYSRASAAVGYDVNGYPYLKDVPSDTGSESVDVDSVLYSNNCFGMTVTKEAGVLHISGLITPDGVKPLPEIASSGRVYASFNPITSSAERDTVRVSWA